MSLRIVVQRSRLSLQPLRNPATPPDWSNNDANNSLDLFSLFGEEGIAEHSAPLFSCHAQTVANLEGLDPGVHYYDTVAPGSFQLRFAVEQRAFWCFPNGLCNCTTLHGDRIGDESITPTNPARWLMHDWESHRDKPAGQDTRVAWSAGCIVVKDADLVQFNSVLIDFGIKPGDLVDGVLEMEA